MEPTSAAQHEAALAGRAPALEAVRDDVWAVALPMPGGHIAYSFLYVLRDVTGGIHLIDPGWDSDANWALVESALAGIGVGWADVRSIVATHLHPDHLGLAERMRAASGAPLLLAEAEQVALAGGHWGRPSDALVAEQLDAWGVPHERRPGLRPFSSAAPVAPIASADRFVVDGERLDVPGFALHVMATPGHTLGSVCLRDDVRGILFTGDHVLPNLHPGLGLGGPAPTNPISDYLASLDRVSGFADHEALPGHGWRFTGLARRAAEHGEHHRKRAREVATVMADRPDASVWEVASELTWTVGWANLDGFFLYSALAQVSMHRDFVAELSQIAPKPGF